MGVDDKALVYMHNMSLLGVYLRPTTPNICLVVAPVLVLCIRILVQMYVPVRTTGIL